MEFVLHSYEEHWPNHPFVFRLPYNNKEPKDLIARYPGRIDPVASPLPIWQTIDTLTQDLDDHEWVWWCIDDKYLTGVRTHKLQSIVCQVRELTDPDIWGVMVTNNPYSSPLTVSSIFGTTEIPFIRKTTYHGFFQPHFIRVKALRRLMLREDSMVNSHLSTKPGLGIMPLIEDVLHSPLPRGKKVFLAQQALLTFGESTTSGALTINALHHMKQVGFTPPSIPRLQTGWITTFDRKIMKYS